MRLVDADALIDELSLVYNIADDEDAPYNIGVMASIKTVKRMPTIEPETAEWISVPCESYLKVICSKCGHEPIDNEDDAFYWLTPYCPFCGRKIVRMNLKDYIKE